MAEIKTNRSAGNKEGGQALARHERENRGLRRWEPVTALASPFEAMASPFELMDRMSEEIDRVFNRVARDVGLSRRDLSLRALASSPTGQGLWSPRVDAFQQGDRFIVRAELPGVNKDDVQVELTGDAVTIHGVRREQHEDEREGYYVSEREYGEFLRTLTLPEGVISETAQATFRDGVLEISMQAAPSEANRGRRLEIKDGSEGNKNN